MQPPTSPKNGVLYAVFFEKYNFDIEQKAQLQIRKIYKDVKKGVERLNKTGTPPQIKGLMKETFQIYWPCSFQEWKAKKQGKEKNDKNKEGQTKERKQTNKEGREKRSSEI